MKSVITAVCILISLVILFVIIERKDFYSGDAVAVQQETVTGKKPTTVTTLTPVEQPAETKPVAETNSVETKPAEEKPVSETKPSETKPVVGTKPTEVKPAETKHVTENKPVESMPVAEEKLAPVAVPFVTEEEAEKLNAEAKVFARKHARKTEFYSKGMSLVSDDRMKRTTAISIEKRFDETFQKHGVTKSREELSKKEIPIQWMIDLNTLTGNCDFEKTEDGYRISSPDGILKIQAPANNIQNTITGMSFELSCNSLETTVKAGVEESGLFRPGKTYLGELSGIQDDEVINFQISAIEHFDHACAFLEISGDVTIHSFRVFQKKIKGATYLEGQISERSVLPDPKESDYPNCRFTAQFEGNVIKAGEACPKEMALIIDGFKDFQILNTNKVKNGEKILCTIIPYDSLPEEEQSIQQSDDLNLFLLDSYYVLNMRTISSFSEPGIVPTSGIFFSSGTEEYISIFERKINPPITQEIVDSQILSVRNELTRMNSMLEGYNEETIEEINARFKEVWEIEKTKDPEGYNRLGDTYVWRNIDNSFWTLPVNYKLLIPEINKLSSDTIDSFVALNEVCNANGVQLIVALVPNNNVVSSRIINEAFRDIPDLQMATYVKQLSEKGIEAIYTTDAVIQNYNRFEFAFNYPEDIHPSDTTQDVIAELLAERIKRFDHGDKLEESLFSTKKESPFFYYTCNNFSPLQTYCFPENCDISDHHAGESFMCRKILFNGKDIPNTQTSPYLMIGNSFIESPSAPPQSAPSILSYRLLSPVNWHMKYAYGPFSDVLTSMFSNPSQYLLGKKVLILYCGTDHISHVDKNSIMVNIKEMDRECVLRNGKTMCQSYSLSSNIAAGDEKQIAQRLGSSQKNTVIKIETSGTWSHTIKLEDGSMDYSKPAICIIPSICGVQQQVSLSIGDQTKQIHSPARFSSKLNSLAFDLPAGTKEITITANGQAGALFAIKDIQIWQ